MKKCHTCKIEKKLINFYKNKSRKDGYHGRCIPCTKKYTEKSKDRIKEFQKKYYKENKESIKESSIKYYNKNKSCVKNYQKTYRKENSEKIKKRRKKYEEENKEKINKYKNEYHKERLKKDPMFKLKSNLRSRVWSILKNKKDKGTQELLGASFEEVKLHLELTFAEGMTWKNYGEWHVDHKIPLASVDTKEEIEKLFHYSNLQALWAFDNLSKGDKI